jgi:hypothetical protein
MVHTKALRLVRVAVVVVLAVGGYLLFVRTPHAERQLLGNLVIHRISVHGLPAIPAVARSASPSTTSIRVLKQAAKSDPDSTGLYEAAWSSTTDANLGVGMVVQLLPDSTRARTVLSANEKQFVTKLNLSGEILAQRTAFSVPSVPQARAESYAMSSSSTKAAEGYAYVVVFQVGRAVVVEIMKSSNTTRSTSDTISITQAEHALLQRAEPSFSMLRTTTPVVASVVFGVIALLIAAGAFFVPEWAPDALRRRRARHEAKELKNARSQYRARGRRAVRRHRAPAWRQPGRR